MKVTALGGRDVLYISQCLEDDLEYHVRFYDENWVLSLEEAYLKADFLKYEIYSSGMSLKLRLCILSRNRRDRLAFSKTLLRKFIKETTTKDTYVGAPLIVKVRYREFGAIPASNTETHV
jgi:hypothetical protein